MNQWQDQHHVFEVVSCHGNLKTLEPPTMKPPKLKPAKMLNLSKSAFYALFEILFLIEISQDRPKQSLFFNNNAISCTFNETTQIETSQIIQDITL